MDSDHIIVFVTAPNVSEGRKIAQILVREKLAACVNILPGMTSIYTWDGEICEESEVLLVIKTRADLFDPLSTTVEKEHVYDVPEVIGVPLIEGNRNYIKWIDEVTCRP